MENFIFFTKQKTNQHKFLKSLSIKTALFFCAFTIAFISSKAQTYDVVWTNPTNVTVSGNTITKTGGFNVYDAGAVSANRLPDCADGFAECTINQMSGKVFGFSPACSWSQLNSPNDIMFGYLVGATEYWIIVNGFQLPAYPSPGASWSSGDKFKLERVGNQMKYYKNGGFLGSYTISAAITTDWCFVGTMAQQGVSSDISNAVVNFGIPSSATCNVDLWIRDEANSYLYNFFPTEKVGIGTMTPTERLDVNGTIRMRTVANDNSLSKYLVVDNNGVVKYKTNASFGGWYKSGTTTVPTSITDDIFNSGKVGIGTNTPAKLLDIYGYQPEFRVKDNTTVGTAQSVSLTLANSVGYWTLSGPRSYDVKNNFSLWWNAGTWKRYLTTTDDGRFLMGDNTSPSVIGTYRLYVDGNAYITGTWSPSDKRLKRDIQHIETPLEKISKLNGYTYYYNEMPDSVLYLPKEKQYGLLAQELLEVMPEAVKENETGYYAVNYDMVIPVLVESIKDQQKTITAQDAKISQLEKEVEEIKNMIKNSGSIPQQGNTAPANHINIRPNPAFGKTTVDYTIAGDYATALIVVYNELGQKVAEYKASQANNGNVEVDVTQFAGGTYFCKLIVDDAILEVKKFMVSK